MELVYVYQKKRKEYGKQPIFQDKLATLNVDLPSDPNYMKHYVEKNPCVTEIQCVPEMSEHEVNTESIVVSNRGIIHTEGGWPKDVDPTDVEHTIRYRKKIEKDEEFVKSVKIMGDSIEKCIKQNNAIDIYGEFFTDSKEDTAVETPSARTMNVYKDPNAKKRSATYISWYPEDGHRIAVAYSILQFQQMSSDISSDSYIWDVENPTAPEQTIISSSPLVCLKYNPKDPHILVGGAYNGLLGYWDTRKGPYACDTSSIEKSHRDPVYSVSWVQSKTGSEFFSVSTDGQVLWWDIRKLSDPTESMNLDPEKNGQIVGGTVIDFETTMPTKFMVGSENGSILICNKKAKTPSDRIQHVYPGHHGPIYSLQRNPFFLKNFLTVGDWTAKIWAEDVRTPIMSTKYHNSYLTDGCWSPTRPAVLFTSRMDGSLDIWDFLFKQTDPTLSLRVSESAIHSLRVQDHGRMVAVGDRDGSLTLLELSDGLSKLQNNEKTMFSQMLEREAKREKALEASAREKRLKAQQKRPGTGAQKDTSQSTQIEELLKQAEVDFNELSMAA